MPKILITEQKNEIFHKTIIYNKIPHYEMRWNARVSQSVCINMRGACIGMDDHCAKMYEWWKEKAFSAFRDFH